MQNNFRWILLTALSIIVFIINVDYTAVNLAFVPISTNLNSSLETVQWILSAYVFAWGLLVIPAGRYADQHNKKNLCLLGLSLFLLASLLAGLATNIYILIAARALQGIAGALYAPAIYALIYLNFSEQERGKAIGLMSMGIGLGLAAGPFIGGILLATFNWRSIFFVNLPIGLVALAIIWLSKNNEQTSNNSKEIISSLIPRELFTNKAFMGCCAGFFLEQYSFATIVVASGLYLQKIRDFSTLKSSFIYLFMTTVFGVIAGIGGSWVDRIGLRIPTLLGLLLMALGSVFFSLTNSASPLWIISLIFFFFGAGMGIAFTALNSGVVKTLAPEHIGIGSSVFLMLALLANTIGIIITSSIYTKVSVADMVQFLTTTANSEQLQQLFTLVNNIGNTVINLNTFNQSMQTLIHTHLPIALNHGINCIMLVNAALCIFAVVLVNKPLSRKNISVQAQTVLTEEM